MSRNQKTIDWILVLIVNFMWATQVPVIRLIGDSLGPVTVAFVPMILSTLIFLPVLRMENRRRGIRMRLGWKDLQHFILPGIIGVFVMQYAYTVGSQMTLAANAGIITLTIPVIVAIFATIWLKEKLNLVRIISFVLAIGGVLMTSVSDISGANFKHGGYLKGNLIFLFACCCCGFYNTYCKKLVDKQYTELEILVYSSLVGSIASIPLLIWVEPLHFSVLLHSGRLPLLALLELGIIVYGVSMLLFFHVLKRMDVTQAILGNYLLPFFIALLGILLLHEKITPLMMVGGIVILFSTLMVSVSEKSLLDMIRKFKISGLSLLLLVFLWSCHRGKVNDRTVISLDGSWELGESGSFDSVPSVFRSHSAVPGLVDMAVPALSGRPYENRVYWYRRVFRLEDISSEIALLKIYKSMYRTRMILNKQAVGENVYCFTPSVFDIRRFLRAPGADNELIIGVGCYKDLPDTVVNGHDYERVNFIPGIYDKVEVQLTGLPYISSIQTAPDLVKNVVRIRAELDKGGKRGESAVRYSIREVSTGKEIVRGDTLVAGNVFDVRAPMTGCRWWSPEDPFLYELELRTEGDSKKVKFGMRSFAFDKDSGVALLNGRPYYMRGTNVCVFRFFEDSARGALPWDEGWVERLHVKFKGMHWNSMRYSIGVPPERWYEIADSVGFLIQDEFPVWDDMRKVEAAQLVREYTQWMRERWNHPCVVIWDAQNETVTAETGKAIGMVRSLDLSNRPWDNGWSPPQSSTDDMECHPYMTYNLKRSRNPDEYAWTHIYSGDGLPDDGPNVRSPSPDGKKYTNPIVINEYEWAWLNRDGSPTKLTDSLYNFILGDSLSGQERFSLYARLLSMATEYWRVHRKCAAVMYFTGLGYSRPGAPRGQTSDNFSDVRNLVFEPHFERLMKPAFAPVGLMLDIRKARYAKNTVLEAPVYVINDTYAGVADTLRLTLSRGDQVVKEVRKFVEVKPLGREILTLPMQLPGDGGRYVLKASVRHSGDEVFSERIFEVKP